MIWYGAGIRTYEDGLGKGLGVGLGLETGIGLESAKGLNLAGFGDGESLMVWGEENSSGGVGHTSIDGLG